MKVSYLSCRMFCKPMPSENLYFRRPEDLVGRSAYFVDWDARCIKYVVSRLVQQILQ